MDRRTTRLIAAGTVTTALGIGAAMQYWPSPVTPLSTAQGPVVVSDVQEVSSTPKMPMPMDVAATAALPASLVSAPAEKTPAPVIELPETPETSGFDCDVSLTANATAGAMIAVDLTAPCHGSERVTLHHNGLMFTEIVQPDGALSLEIPALAENALVIASFFDGAGAVAKTDVTSVPFYERVVLQWRGNAGLQLHAREFDAEYFSDGHIWQGSENSPARAATGDGGFLTTLGSADAPDGLFAEVYTFPSGMTQEAGTVTLTVEAEIQNANCGSRIEAQTLEIRADRDLRSKELTIEVPGCETIGDFLMLKNIVEDLTIASR